MKGRADLERGDARAARRNVKWSLYGAELRR